MLTDARVPLPICGGQKPVQEPLLLPWMELRPSDFGSKPFYLLSPLVNPENIFKAPKIIAKA